MRLLILAHALLALAFLTPQVVEVAEEETFDQTHSAWSGVLAKHLRKGEMDYGALAKQHADLDTYIAGLEAVEAAQFAAWSVDERHAFWINAYNAYTIKLIVDNYPLASIRDIGTPEENAWDKPFIPLAALFPKAKTKQLSLNDIEHKLLRPEMKDARIHAAVNCASVGCPPLATRAFSAKHLNKMLDEQARTWLANPMRNKFVPKENRVQLSQLFNWYGDDFKPKGAKLGTWLAKYAPAEYSEWLATNKFEVQFLEYDWRLNDTKRKR